MAGQAAAAYSRGAESRVDVWIGAYAVGSTSGAEMISYNNRLYGTAKSTVFTEQTRKVALGGGRTFEVREIPVTDGGNERLIWYWYEVGGRPTLNTLVVKWLEGLAFISNKHTLERVVAISSEGGSLEDRRQHLGDFLRAHAGCLIDREIEAGCRG
jgi:EpsI family protein